MIHVRPFRAWRPAAHTAHLVGSRSFLTYSPKQLREKLSGNPYSFLHIIHADQGLSSASPAERFDRVRRRFLDFTGQGILLREDAPAYYLYEQSCAAFTSRGLIGAVSVADYEEGRVKRHEHTLAAREELFKDYLDHTGINAEPVLLAVPDAAGLEAVLEDLAKDRTLYDFSTTDQVRHRFWKVDDPAQVQALQERFARTDALYIADGHHRCASSARLAESAHCGPEDPRSSFLAYMVPRTELHIYNYDRVVKGLNGHSGPEFLEALRGLGRLTPLPSGPAAPKRGTVLVFTRGGWHGLVLPRRAAKDPVDALDAARLSQDVLSPVLGIKDLRTDKRVRFVPGTHPTEELERTVTEGKADVAFHLCAVGFDELAAVADSGGYMPPKSTWIEPKLRSGLTIYSLTDR